MNINQTRSSSYGCLGVQANSMSLHAITFIIGAISFFNFEFIGEVYPAEIALVLMIPLLWKSKYSLLRDVEVKKILFFGLLWLVSQIITDLIRSTPTNDLLRGWASIIFFLLEFVGLYLLLSGSTMRIMLFLLGLVLSGFLQIIFLPSVFFDAHPWKFGYALPVTLSFLIFITYVCGSNVHKLKWWMLPLSIFGGLSIYLGFRSLGGMIILTSFLIYFRTHWIGRALVLRLNSLRIGLLTIIVMVASVGILNLYGYSVEQGWLGERAKDKYERQVSGDLGILFGGRIESFASIPAIVDSPIIGHGSWAKDPSYRVFLYDLVKFGYYHSNDEVRYRIENSDLIPAHSHILQSWVWSGLPGAVFWLVILFIVIRVLIKTYQINNEFLLFVIFFGLISIWDIFFSPFSSFMRMQWAIRLCIFIISIQMCKNSQSNHII
mgnify:CR=1 FL=1|tara:strand:+ start:555 stop:1859 length:1305 start_codon:yes stop_codon:yes gene_type:complete